jgi:release factor glutamine methyltransferase
MTTRPDHRDEKRGSRSAVVPQFGPAQPTRTLPFRRSVQPSGKPDSDGQFWGLRDGLLRRLGSLRARPVGRRQPVDYPPVHWLYSSHEAAAKPALPIRILRRFARLALGARYILTQRHRHRRLTLEHVSGRPILVLPDVFNPVLFKSGALLAETLNENLIPPGSSVLDMGTGTGVGAITAAGWADRVVAIDINPEAVRCTKINLLLNKVNGRVDVRQGDLFDVLSSGDPAGAEQFDVVLFNPPYFRGDPVDSYDRAWRSIDVIERFAAQLEQHMSVGGFACLVLSSDGDSHSFLEAFRRQQYTIEVLAQRHLINETLTVYRVYLDR